MTSELTVLANVFFNRMANLNFLKTECTSVLTRENRLAMLRPSVPKYSCMRHPIEEFAIRIILGFMNRGMI